MGYANRMRGAAAASKSSDKAGEVAWWLKSAILLKPQLSPVDIGIQGLPRHPIQKDNIGYNSGVHTLWQGRCELLNLSSTEMLPRDDRTQSTTAIHGSSSELLLTSTREDAIMGVRPPLYFLADSATAN